MGCLGVRSMEGPDSPVGLVRQLESNKGKLARFSILSLQYTAIGDGKIVGRRRSPRPLEQVPAELSLVEGRGNVLDTYPSRPLGLRRGRYDNGRALLLRGQWELRRGHRPKEVMTEEKMNKGNDQGVCSYSHK